MHAVTGMDASELLLTATRAFAVYVLMLVVMRALGKRTIGNFSAFDLLVALMLGEVVDEIIQFLVASVTLFATHAAFRETRGIISPLRGAKGY